MAFSSPCNVFRLLLPPQLLSLHVLVQLAGVQDLIRGFTKLNKEDIMRAVSESKASDEVHPHAAVARVCCCAEHAHDTCI